MVYLWQRLLYYPFYTVCIELDQKLMKEQMSSDARERLLLQILPAGVIKKLLSDGNNKTDEGKGEFEDEDEGASSPRTALKRSNQKSKQRIKEMIDLDMSSSR
jgi:hypothetical protein